MEAEKSPATKRWAIFWTAVVSCVLVLLIGAILFPVFAQAKTSGPNPRLSRVKQAGLALLMYADENDQRFPPDLSNPEVLNHACTLYMHGRSVLYPASPEDGGAQANGLLSAQLVKDITNSSATILSFYSRPYKGLGVVCYADGHGRTVVSFEAMLEQLTVEPFAARSLTQKERTGG